MDFFNAAQISNQCEQKLILGYYETINAFLILVQVSQESTQADSGPGAINNYHKRTINDDV